VLERAELSGSQVVCDLGAGRNPLAFAAYQANARRAYLIDAMHIPSKESLGDHHFRMTADISCLPLEDESIDVVLSVSVLEHLTPPARENAIWEIQRILRPGGKALVSIGSFLHVSDVAQRKMRELPYFTNRGCAVYFPIDIKAFVQSASGLHLTSDEDLEYLPGFEAYDMDALANEPGLCFERFSDYEELQSDPHLRQVIAYEIGLQFHKP
jgi:SAM-dependent methyltransferase